MHNDRAIHGVPMALQHDGWWLTDGPAAPPQSGQSARGPVLTLLALVLLGDVLFWHQTLGLSLVVFAAAVFAATSPRRPNPWAVALLVVSMLPVIDYVQALSVAILVLGLPYAIALNRDAEPLPALLALIRRLPVALPRDIAAGLRQMPQLRARSFARNWAFPLGGACVLVSLLSQANPVLEDALMALTHLRVDPLDLTLRAMFWAGLALLVGPLLTLAPSVAITLKPVTLPRLGLNAASVTNALILFNAMLALQTAMDAAYLYSGNTPPGITLATYAHRGAYPLLATALLAGAFALVARPWVAERPALKPLLLIWLGQNVLLTLSALYRLDLYVRSFGLTYLRVHAAIWMALVAAGLALTLMQITAHKSNRWLLVRCAALGAGTLYLCAFVNFASLIASDNVARYRAITSDLCDLGPTAVADIRATLPDFYDCTLSPPVITGWRDWGFRNWRVLDYLKSQART